MRLHGTSRAAPTRASSRAGRAVVDGAGVRRVRTALLVDSTTPLVVREAAVGDEDLLLEWANDPLTRRNSFNPAIIGAEEHHRWLRHRLRPGQRGLLLVIETQDGVPLATVRFDPIATGWRLNYSVGAQYRGRGLGRPVAGAGHGGAGAQPPRGILASGARDGREPALAPGVQTPGVRGRERRSRCGGISAVAVSEGHPCK